MVVKRGFETWWRRALWELLLFQLNCIMRATRWPDRSPKAGEAGEAESLHVPHQDQDSLASLPDKARHGPLSFLKRPPPACACGGAGQGRLQ